MNFFLIGFMGCGKSTLGKKIAKKMGYDFIDVDKEIEKQEQLSIQQIFELKGEEHFRSLESEWLNHYNQDNHIISLGGGTPCFNQNLELIHQKGKSIYLKMNAGLLFNRLINAKAKRPLIEKLKHSPEELKIKITELLDDRKQFYNQANIIFDADNMTADKLEELIANINAFC